ncbi:MAG: FG-GAP repeat domain-containing protein [bacterium]
MTPAGGKKRLNSGAWQDLGSLCCSKFLKYQPQTNIRFQLVENTGFEECALRTAPGDYSRIALGDYNSDGYVDVLILDQGLWRNLRGSGKFKRVDKELGINLEV